MKRRIVVEHGEVKRIALLMKLYMGNGIALAGLPEKHPAGAGDPENGFDAWRHRSG